MAHANFGLQVANANAVADICHRLDGIPLALELAAARLKAKPVDALAQRLDSGFKLLTSNNQEALPRHRTLQALVGWSYDLFPKLNRCCCSNYRSLRVDEHWRRRRRCVSVTMCRLKTA